MQVIAGTLKGRKLKSPTGIRPVTSMIKEALFNILSGIEWENADVLDIFAGSGNLGIEALSRGAKRVVFVDAGGESRHIISENLRGVSWEGEIIIGDFRGVVKKLFKKNEKFTIIFADPPFDMNLGREVLDVLDRYRILGNDGLLVLRVRNREKLEIGGRYRAEMRTYGDSTVYFISSGDLQ